MNVEIFAKGRNGYDAIGYFDGKGVTVKKGSILCKTTATNVNPIVIKLRNDRSIVSADFVLLKDVAFRSASTAANFVTGNISNGMRVWKVSHRKDLGKFKEEING